MVHSNHEEAFDLTQPLLTQPIDRSYIQRLFGLTRAVFWRRCKIIIFIVALAVALSLASVFLTGHDSSLASCLDNRNVSFVVQGSNGWAESVTPWNLRVKYLPVAIAIPKSIEHIQAAVSCGVKSKVRVTALAGGHSYASFGFGGEDGHLVIQLDRMHGVTLYDNHTAKIQPGARLGHVSSELYNQGRRAIPHGACPGVGLAGHVLHGGYGRASRTHGLTLDWLIGAKVVLANGSLVHCSATENADLYWAIRGAGSSFGIVAEFEFSTFAAPHHVTPFTIDLTWDEEHAIQAVREVQDFARSAPTELNLFLYLTATSQIIQGLYFGEEHALHSTLQPLLSRLDEAKVSFASPMEWIEGLEHYADGEALNQTPPYSSHATIYTTSLMTPALTKTQIHSLVSEIFANINNAAARHSWDIFIEMHGGAKSAVAQVSPTETSYVHRDKMLLFQLSDVGDNGEFTTEGFEILKQYKESVTQSMADGDWGMYANFLDTQLDADSARKLYYGGNLPELKRLKAKYDADDLFWNPQGIPVSSG